MKTRWYITVESDAQNMFDFDHEFFIKSGLTIPNNSIVGIFKEVKEEK